MFDTKRIDDLVKRLSDALPSNLKDAKHDIEKSFRWVLQGVFSKLDIVTREEFDAQAKVLIRTRKKLEALEKQFELLKHSVDDERPLD